jgi:NADPH-dependent F420 reductase
VLKSDKVAVLGGTGSLGSGLALRLALAGRDVVIGSRDADKAQAKARDLSSVTSNATICGTDYASAAESADIVILAVPFSHQLEVLGAVRDQLADKILVDATVPLMPPKVSQVQLPAEGCAALRAQTFLGDAVHVVSAFQNVGAHHLHAIDQVIDCEVLVTGNSAEARQIVVDLVADCGLKGHSAGVLANAVAAEALTSILIAINRATKSDRAGIRITGI